jgi:hypothetical protein
MARMSLEKKALTDPRFRILGSHLNALAKAPRDALEHAYGLYIAARVWDYCIDRGLLVVHSRDLEAMHAGLAEAFVDAELGEFVHGTRRKRVRVRGGIGRLDYLVKAHESGRRGAEHGHKGGKYGHLGGRPAKAAETPPPPVSKTPGGGDTKTPPLASASASAPRRRQEESESPRETRNEDAVAGPDPALPSPRAPRSRSRGNGTTGGFRSLSLEQAAADASPTVKRRLLIEKAVIEEHPEWEWKEQRAEISKRVKEAEAHERT